MLGYLDDCFFDYRNSYLINKSGMLDLQSVIKSDEMRRDAGVPEINKVAAMSINTQTFKKPFFTKLRLFILTGF